MSKPPVSTQDTISSPPSAEQMYPAPVKLDRNPNGGQSNDALQVNRYLANGGRTPAHAITPGNPFGGGRATS